MSPAISSNLTTQQWYNDINAKFELDRSNYQSQSIWKNVWYSRKYLIQTFTFITNILYTYVIERSLTVITCRLIVFEIFTSSFIRLIGRAQIYNNICCIFFECWEKWNRVSYKFYHSSRKVKTGFLFLFHHTISAISAPMTWEKE